MSIFVNITHCQVKEFDGDEYSYTEWIFTTKPGLFGYPGGIACITGVILIVVLTLIVGFALPCIRRSGHFELFYFTHLLFIAYYVLLLFHAPDFWKWFVGPLAIFLVETLYRLLCTFFGHGKTSVKAAVVFPSSVTGLVIYRPERFKFNPGDWVFIKIPSISLMEWHAFTISSAPEVEDYFTLHIRGVGDWTRNLHNYVKEEHAKQAKGLRRNSTKLEKMTASVREKLLVAKNSFSNPRRKESDLPYYETNKEKHGKRMGDSNVDEKKKKEKRKNLQSKVGSLYSKTEKPLVQFRKKGLKIHGMTITIYQQKYISFL